MTNRKRISVVTVAYNIEDYVEQTIRSVVQQKTPDCQYVFIDGGSTDRTVEIARRYEEHIDVLISEKDAGQYHAICKGFAHCTGDVIGWINADDILMPWTISVVSEIFAKFPDVEWICGTPALLNDEGQLVRLQTQPAAYPRRFIANGWYQKSLAGYLQQEGMFWRRSLWDKVGGLNTDYRLAGDFDLWTRFAAHADLVPVDTPLAGFRERPGVQRSSHGAVQYEVEVASICVDKPRPSFIWRRFASMGLVARHIAMLLIRHRSSAIRYDRGRREWVKLVSHRGLSRVSLATLIEEWLTRRGIAAKAVS